jgi:mitochondrial import inner membrane translocase subunit TIM50
MQIYITETSNAKRAFSNKSTADGAKTNEGTDE